MTEQRARARLADQISVVSAATVGLTLMGLAAILASLSQVATLTEELLAADAMLFLVACLASYFAMRTRDEARSQLYERLADISFIIGMVAIVAIGAIVALRLF